MALTDVQDMILHEILEIPMGAESFRLSDPDNLAGYKRTVTAENVLQAEAALQSRLALLSSAQETKLKTYLDRYDAIGTDMTVIETGGIGNIAGVTDSPQHERILIAQKVKVLLPFFRAHEEIAKQKHVDSDGAIPVVR